MNKDIGLLILAGAVVVVGVLQYAKDPVNVQVMNEDGKVQVIERTLGASPGPDVYQHQTFFEGFTKAGRSEATTTGAAATLTTAEFDHKTSYLEINPSNAATITFMASTSAPFSNLKAGQSIELVVFNASSSAALITFAAGTGVDLQEDRGGVVTVDTLDMGRFTFLKKANSDVIAWWEAGQKAD